MPKMAHLLHHQPAPLLRRLPLPPGRRQLSNRRIQPQLNPRRPRRAPLRLRLLLLRPRRGPRGLLLRGSCRGLRALQLAQQRVRAPLLALHGLCDCQAQLLDACVFGLVGRGTRWSCRIFGVVWVG